MTVILLLFVVLCLCTAKYKNVFTDEVFNDNFAKEQTECVNGIFVAFVFLSHFHFEIETLYPIDSFYLFFQRICGQCIVCSFLFYSGYGMYESLKRNRAAYSRKLVLSKFPRLLLRFDLCVLLYAVVQVCLGNNVTIGDFLLSLLTIKSLGNSNWYIFYILLMYVAIWIAFSFFNDDRKSLLFVVLVNAIYTVFFLFFYRNLEHYYVTSFILPMGMYFARYKEKIEKVILSKKVLLLFLSSFSVCCALWIISNSRLHCLIYNAVSLFFTISLILLTYKIQFKNKMISLFGRNVFQIYIMRHLPMILFKPVQFKINGGGCTLH